MKKINLLALMLLCSVASVFAKGEITAKAEVVAGYPDRFNVTVSMSNDEQEVRGLECSFTLPEGVSPIGIPSYNEERFDGFIPTLDIRDSSEADNLSKVTFLSLGGDYVTGTEGEIFSFTVQVSEDLDNVSFDINSEISYDGGKSENVTTEVNISEASPYKMSVLESSINVDEEATVTIAIENELAVGGFELVVELPEGLEFVTKSSGKVDWTFSNRISKTKSASENQLADNKVKLMVIDAMSADLVKAGEGEILSFKVKAAANASIADESQITISGIKISKTTGKQFNQNEELVVLVEKTQTLPGDVNADGVIDGSDMVMLREVLLHDGYDTTGLYPDVNDDGTVNGSDLVDLRELILHKQ